MVELSPRQCKMARAALGFTIHDLAKRARVSTNTITRLEGGERLRERTIADIRRTLEDAGVTFIDGNGGGPGVRLSKGG